MAGLHDRSRTYHERRIRTELFPRVEPAQEKLPGMRVFRGSRFREDFFFAPKPREGYKKPS